MYLLNIPFVYPCRVSYIITLSIIEQTLHAQVQYSTVLVQDCTVEYMPYLHMSTSGSGAVVDFLCLPFSLQVTTPHEDKCIQKEQSVGACP